MTKYILGNWKMNGTQAMAQELAKAVAGQGAPGDVKVALFPPAPLIPVVGWMLRQSAIGLGAQDISPEGDGAFTGDVSAAILKDAGCAYAIVGHSERRALHGETDDLVRAKARAALAGGLTPVICVGESLKERESGNHLKTVESQLKGSLPEGEAAKVIIAYEPVWAIGSGKTPTTAEISEVHKSIATVLSYAKSGAALGIVYGGSVKRANAHEILHAEGVDGVLVGGASLKADEFCAIIKAAQ